MNQNDVPVDDSTKILVTIVKKGLASKAVQASMQAGAKGGTIMIGKGTCSHKSLSSKLFGSTMQEREIILTLVQGDMAEAVLKAIADEVLLEEPCNGVAFIINAKSVMGITHLLGCNHVNSMIGGSLQDGE